MRADFATMGALSIMIAALASCRATTTTAVDEPPKSGVEPGTPAPPPSQGGELGLALGDGPGAAPSVGPYGQVIPQLGAPCTPASRSATPTPAPIPGARPVLDPCGTKGRVSVRWDAASTTTIFKREDVGCALVDLDQKRLARDPNAFASERRLACAKDGRVWGLAACMMCRVPFAGWSATGLVAEMTKEQSLAFQARLGLPNNAPLGSTEAWSTAIATAAN